MVTSIKISSLILIVLSMLSCQNTKEIPIQQIEKKFGLFNTKDDSIGVELKLEKFKNWKELLKETQRIVCQDSLPKITIKSDKEIKTIYFRNYCMENIICMLIKERNTIKIHNDTISKLGEKLTSLDGLASILKKEIENNGKNFRLSDSPEKLLIYISYDENGLKKLHNTLKTLINEYEKITDRKDIKIILNRKLRVPPPSPSLN